MLSERAVEQYRFTCSRCGGTSVDTYQVLNVTDAEGDLFCYYHHDGYPCESPVAAETMCPNCHCGPVHVNMVARSLVIASDG